MLEFMKQPWPWYVSGPVIGLVVPILLLLGNKSFGISSSFRDICAVCFPGNIPFFQYEWKKELWNLSLVFGIIAGSALSMSIVGRPDPPIINPTLSVELSQYGIKTSNSLVPLDIFNWHALLSRRGFILMVVGGFLVGFGTRYAGGCTSGHIISGLSTLQLPSLIATISFMAGGIVMANFILPFILSL